MLPLFSNYQHDSSYVLEFKSAYSPYYMGYVPNSHADTAAEDDNNVYNTIERDPTISQGMQLMTLSIAGEDVDVKFRPGMEREQALAKWMLGNIQDFPQAGRNIAHGAIMYGLGVLAKEIEKRECRLFPGIEFATPVRLREVDRRRLRIERHDQNQWTNQWAIKSMKYDRYVLLRDRKDLPDYPYPFCFQDYVFYTGEYSEQYPYGKGLAEVLFPLAYISKKVIQYWADLCESWRKPNWHVQVDPSLMAAMTSLGGGTVTEQQVIRAVHEMIRNGRADNTLITSTAIKLNPLEKGTVGNNILEKCLEYLDKRKLLAIMGTELVGNAGGSGASYAMAQIHRGGFSTIFMYYRTRLEEYFKKQLVIEFFWRNRKQIQQAGLTIPDVTDFDLKIIVKSEELKEKVIEGSDGAGAAKLASQI